MKIGIDLLNMVPGTEDHASYSPRDRAFEVIHRTFKGALATSVAGCLTPAPTEQKAR